MTGAPCNKVQLAIAGPSGDWLARFSLWAYRGHTFANCSSNELVYSTQLDSSYESRWYKLLYTLADPDNPFGALWIRSSCRVRGSCVSDVTWVGVSFHVSGNITREQCLITSLLKVGGLEYVLWSNVFFCAINRKTRAAHCGACTLSQSAWLQRLPALSYIDYVFAVISLG